MSTPTPRHICDCGKIYSSLAAIESCQINNHGKPPPTDRLTAINADLLEALEEIASDCADLQRVNIVSHAEARTWKTIENKARTAIANAKIHHTGENSTKERT